MSETPELKLIIEALLLAADEPLTVNRIQQLFENAEAEEDEAPQALPEKNAIKEALEALNEDYAERGLECIELASGYTLRVKQDYAPWVAKLWDMKPARYTRAFLETLALIAYKQPITRSEIEQVRGVAVSSYIIKGLLEREWIKIVGHRDVPGKPAVLATTKTFLDYFNLKSLDELPDLQDIVDLDKAGDQLEMQLQQAMSEAGVDLNVAAETTTDSEAAVDAEIEEAETGESESAEGESAEGEITENEIADGEIIEPIDTEHEQEENLELEEQDQREEASNVVSIAPVTEES